MNIFILLLLYIKETKIRLHLSMLSYKRCMSDIKGNRNRSNATDNSWYDCLEVLPSFRNTRENRSRPLAAHPLGWQATLVTDLYGVLPTYPITFTRQTGNRENKKLFVIFKN